MGFYEERIFPWMCDRMMDAPPMERLTRAALADVTGDVLEIGFGSGRSLAFYPTTGITRLTALEPSHGMTARARDRVAAAPFPVELVPGAGERLPFAEEQFDAVVLVFTLCSVDDPAQVIGEAKRVLKAGGRLHFVEHVASRHPGHRRWQERLNPLQRAFACGCNLNRDPLAIAEAAGLHVELGTHDIQPDFPMFPTLFPVSRCVAVKRA